MFDDSYFTWKKPNSQIEIDESVDLSMLSGEQKQVLQKIQSGENLLVTGQGGCGKSFLIKKIKQLFPLTALTSTTGVAAVNIGGLTLHSWAGFGIHKQDPIIVANKLMTDSKKERYLNRIKQTKILVIDEISMMEADFIDFVNKVFQLVRNKFDQPFGGIQVLFFGDFLQLPPISKEKDINGKFLPPKFIFESKFWREFPIHVIELTKIFRQEDVEFCSLLQRVRKGVITIQDMNFLSTKNNIHITDENCVKIYCDNKTVDLINNNEVSKLLGESKKFIAKDFITNEDNLSYEEVQLLHNDLKQSCNAPEELILKIDTRVMMLRNTFIDLGIVNGSCGTITEFDEYGFPIVKFDNGESLTITKEDYELKENDELIAKRTQLPLRIAYALTAHKVQGATLDKIIVNCERMFFEAQIYVSLSRVKTPEGLYLINFSPKKIKANGKALQFYKLYNPHLYQDVLQ